MKAEGGGERWSDGDTTKTNKTSDNSIVKMFPEVVEMAGEELNKRSHNDLQKSVEE